MGTGDGGMWCSLLPQDRLRRRRARCHPSTGRLSHPFLPYKKQLFKMSPRLATARNHVHRILLVDGMEVVRLGLDKIIAAASGVMVCAATGDYDNVRGLLKRHRPHLMIAEPFHHCQDGIIWIKDLARAFPQTKILVASSNAEATYAERALRAGASGYWMKSGSAAELLEAIEMVLSGEPVRQPSYRVACGSRIDQSAGEGSGPRGPAERSRIAYARSDLRRSRR